MTTLSRQIAALDAAIAILDGRKQRPKPAQMEMLIEDAKAALETLRAVEAQK
jgi:hypothetical protein